MLHTSLVHVVLRLNDLADHHWIAARCDHAPTFVHQRQRPLRLSFDGLFVADLDAVDRSATDQGTRLAEDRRTARTERRVESQAFEGEFVEAVRPMLGRVVVGHHRLPNCDCYTVVGHQWQSNW